MAYRPCNNRKHNCRQTLNKYIHWKEQTPYITLSLDELRQQCTCDSILLKRLIARLRRKQHKTQEDRLADWLFFKKLFEDHHVYWITNADAKMISSIMATYVDHAEALESSNAATIVAVVCYDQLSTLLVNNMVAASSCDRKQIGDKKLTIEEKREFRKTHQRT